MLIQDIFAKSRYLKIVQDIFDRSLKLDLNDFKTPSTLHRFQTKTILPDTATVHTTTLKTINENGSFRKRSPEWNDLKTVLYENAVFLVWTAKTILSENDDVTTTTLPGCRPLNREHTR